MTLKQEALNQAKLYIDGKKCPGTNCQRKSDCFRYHPSSTEPVGCFAVIDGHIFTGFRNNLPLVQDSFLLKRCDR